MIWPYITEKIMIYLDKKCSPALWLIWREHKRRGSPSRCITGANSGMIFGLFMQRAPCFRKIMENYPAEILL